jgi:hypothetical protein
MNVTKQESDLIKSLLILWDKTYDAGPCKPHCDCERCRALDEAGEHHYLVFDSLKEKTDKFV